MMKKHIFRTATAMLAFAGLTAALAGCGSGLFDTEDEPLEPSLSVSLNSSSSTLDGVGFGDVVDLVLDVSLQNAVFDEAFVTAVANAASSAVDISDYFDVRFVSSTGTDETDTIIAKEDNAALISILATSAVTAKEAIISKADASYTGANSKFSAKISVEIDDPDNVTAASGKLVLKAKDKSGQNGLSGAATSYSFSKVEANWGLELPTAGQIISAYKTDATGATVIALKKRTKQNITAGTKVGSLTVNGSTNVPVFALTDVSKKSRKIPVYTAKKLVLTNGISVGLLSDYVDVSDLTDGKFDATDSAACVAKPIYAEDFTYLTSSNSNSTYYKYENGSQTAAVSYEFVLSGMTETFEQTDIAWATWLVPTLVNGALVHDGASQSGPRGMFTYDGDHLWGASSTGLSYTDGQKYAVEFDITVGAGSEVYLYNSAVNATKVAGTTLDDLKAAGSGSTIDQIGGLYLGNYSAGYLSGCIENYIWGIEGTTAGTYHIKLVIEYSETAGSSKITPYINGTAGDVVSDIGGGDAQGITVQTARGTKSTLDNIVVYGLGE